MKNSLTLSLFAVFLLSVGCVGIASGQTDTDDVPPMSADPFVEIENCRQYWSSLYNEWKQRGGKVARSVVKMREHTDADRQSRLSSLIRRSWQNQSGDLVDQGAWAWPIPMGVRLGIEHATFDYPDIEVPESCRSLSWLMDLFHQDMGAAGLCPIELPSTSCLDTDWNSYGAAQWIAYWLFAGVR